MSSAPKTSSDKAKAFKDILKANNLEDQFLSSAGLTSLDEFSSLNFEDPYPSQPTVTAQSTTSAARDFPKPQQKSTADAVERPSPTVASDVLVPFCGTHIVYASRKKLSYYIPSSLMMDYIVHQINFNLVDNFYFKRSAPDYHPYVLRLYYAVVFYIQCLRAGHDVGALDISQHQFLSRFLDAHPPESLTICGPLIPLFKTLCTSQPEILTYGKLYPRLPAPIGPNRRRDFIRDSPDAFCLPNVPGILALLEDLNSKINANQPVYPKKGAHIPVTSDAHQAIVFGHHSFPVPDERSDLEKWSLCSSGLQYPCEADARLNEAFAERYSNFDFPGTAANDALMEMDYFLSLDVSLAWFSQVKNVAATAASYYEGSGSLIDCPPHGLTANQFPVLLQSPVTLPTAPACSADRRALFPFSFRLRTSVRVPPSLSEAMASYSQTNIRMFIDHPYLANFGRLTIAGGFWDIRPEELSPADDSSYLSINDTCKRMMKSKN